MSNGAPAWQGALLLVAVLAGMGSLWAARAWSSGDGEQGAGFEMPPEPVGTQTASARPWRATRTLLATLAPEASIDVRVEVGGRLVEVGFASGATVQAGDVLARVDSAVEAAELRSLEAELRALVLRRDRLVQLGGGQGTTQMDADQAAADVDAAQARADGLRARIRQKLVVAPFAGRVGVRTHHPGQVVDPGTQLTTLVSASNALMVDLWAPQALIPALPAGAALTVRVDEVASEAVVEVVEPAADATRRAVRVRARLDAPPPGWLPGMAAQVELAVDASVDRVVVPAGAIVWSPLGPLVYRVDRDGAGQVVAAAPVEVLSDLGDEVVLAGGVEAGQVIVTEGAFKLHEGAAVAPIGGGGGASTEGGEPAAGGQPAAGGGASDE
jgi:membrane fusion protein (multidrug efflux system)